MMRTITAACCFCLVSAAVFAGQPAARPVERQERKSLEIRSTLGYLQYLPPGYADDPTNAKAGEGDGWPLVLFLHGAGERGDDLGKMTTTGLPRNVGDGQDFPFVMISPQCPTGEWWDAPRLLQLLDHVERELKVDRDRIYVTGLSMGGFGTWELARAAPDRFAAIVPICGGGDPNRIGRSKGAATLPVWAFHGEEDEVVVPKRSQEMIDALRAAGHPDAKLTIYADVGHDSWTKTYADPAVFEWLLGQRLGRRPATVPTTRPATR